MDKRELMRKNMRNKRSMLFCCLIILSGLMIASCKKNKVGVTDTVTPTDLIQNASSMTPTPSSGSERKDVKNTNPKHIRWAVTNFRNGAPSEDSQKRINEVLKEQGVDCTLEFVFNSSFYTNEDYMSWVMEEECDIFSLGYWNDPFSCIKHAKQTALPLNNWLNSDTGKKLRAAYGEAEWLKMSPDRNTLAVPCWSVPEYYNCALYIAVNEKYSDFFSSFDGTYASLKEMYKCIGDSNQKIEISTVTNDVIAGLLGYDLSYSDSIPYDPKSKRAVSPEKFGAEASDLFKMIYEDLQNGVLINSFDQGFDYDKEKASFAYIFKGARSIPEGYAVFCVSRDLYECNLNLSYAVSKVTERRELALKVLSICLSNPEISAIINWGSERANTEKWTEKTHFRYEDGLTELSGFYPVFSEEESKRLNSYAKVLDEELSGLYSFSQGKYVLKTNYSPSYDLLEKTQDSFLNGVDALNREIGNWLEHSDNS